MDIVEYYNSLSPYLPGYVKASITVIQITIFSVVLSWIFGLIGALGKSSRNKYIQAPFNFYVWFIRGTPALTQIFIVYFGFAQIGIKFSPFIAGLIALSFNSGAYVSEIIRSGIIAIPKGQMESAVSLGMTKALAFRRIILPQVIRIILPTITNQGINLLKTTSLLSTITIMELTLYTQIAVAATFRPFDFYIVSALFYLIMTSILSTLSTYLEKKKSIAYK